MSKSDVNVEETPAFLALPVTRKVRPPPLTRKALPYRWTPNMFKQYQH